MSFHDVEITKSTAYKEVCMEIKNILVAKWGENWNEENER